MLPKAYLLASSEDSDASCPAWQEHRPSCGAVAGPGRSSIPTSLLIRLGRRELHCSTLVMQHRAVFGPPPASHARTELVARWGAGFPGRAGSSASAHQGRSSRARAACDVRNWLSTTLENEAIATSCRIGHTFERCRRWVRSVAIGRLLWLGSAPDWSAGHSHPARLTKAGSRLHS